MEEIKKKINRILIDNNMQLLSELSSKTVNRLINLEKHIEDVEQINVKQIAEIKDRKLTKSSIANIPELGISRKTLYNDKVFLEYVELKILEQKNHFNEKSFIKLKEAYKELEKQYDKVTDHLLENSILKAEIFQYKKQIDELIIDKNRLHSLLKANRKTN